MILVRKDLYQETLSINCEKEYVLRRNRSSDKFTTQHELAFVLLFYLRPHVAT